VHATLPDGPVRDLLADGVVAGIGGTVIFLPQICLLFLLISLLESTGYLARAAFVIDRLMRPVRAERARVRAAVSVRTPARCRASWPAGRSPTGATGSRRSWSHPS
jgi:hypothetical protein